MKRKFIALTFDYSIKKLEEIGRSWSSNVYKEKEHIFRYSAASYASFLHHNPDECLWLFTDDPEHLRNEIEKYEVSLKNVVFVDWKKELNEFKKHKYAFKPLIELIRYFSGSEEYIIKLDNDLICKKPFTLQLSDKQVLVWKREGLVDNGDPRWGEKLVCQSVVGTTNFIRFNVGVLGLPPVFWMHHQEYLQVCDAMIDVDISNVTDVNSKIYHCCEQTSYNWMFHKYNYNVLETYDFFEHHFEQKTKCIEQAEHLLKGKL